MLKFGRLLVWVFALTVLWFSFSHAQVNKEEPAVNTQDRPDYVPGEMIIKFKENQIDVSSKNSNQQINTLSVQNDFEVKEKLPESNIVVVSIDKGQDMDNQIDKLESDPRVEYAEPNYLYYAQSDDPYYGELWWLEKTSWANAIPMVLNTWTTTTGTIIAVIDVGVDYNHPDLINNMWDGTNCVSDKWMFLWLCMHWYDFTDNDKTPLPTTSTHGTHVAGIIAATMNNNIWVVGVNPYAKIMALRAGDRAWLTSDAIIKSINFAKDNGAKVINASFGGAWASDGILQAIQSFQSVWGIFVTAAWNNSLNHDTRHNYPCDYNVDNIICVWSSTSWDILSSFSDRSSTYIDTLAPGEHIKSTVINVYQSTWAFDDFESSLNLPLTWAKQWTQNQRSIINRGDSFGNVLTTNTGSSYLANNISSVSENINLAWSDGAELSLDIGCDTEYSTSSRTDYLSILLSKDGTNFTETARLDEAEIDAINWVVWNGAGTAIAHGLLFDLTWVYLTPWFTVKFQWVTNGTDNNHNWCFIDNVNVQKYQTLDASYGYMNGTSMSTPYVAWLVSLARTYAPDSTPAQIKNAIIYSGDYIPALNGKTVAGTRINIKNTLLALKDFSPTLSSIHIASNNTHTNYAKLNDVITLSFTGSQNLSWVAVKINGVDVIVSWANTYREATTSVTGSMLEWSIAFQIDYQNFLWLTGLSRTWSTDGSNVIVDYSNPNITILNWSWVATWTSIILNITGSDTNGIEKIMINNTLLWSGTSRTWLLNLLPGSNIFTVTGFDFAGNTVSISPQIIRIPYTYSWTSKIIDANTVQITFNSDFAGDGFVMYWTWGFVNSIGSGDTTNHSIVLTNLDTNTTYIYKTYAVYQGITWEFSSGMLFKTPDTFDSTQTWSKFTTWSVFVVWFSSTWVVFDKSWAITIHSDFGNSDIAMITKWLSITTKWIWDGIIHWPVQISFSWTAPSLNNYTHAASLTFEIWSSQTSLVFTWTTGVVYPTVNLGVWSIYNDKTLKVYRSDNNLPYEYIADCLVSNWMCSFTTNSFSTFTILTPNPASPSAWGGGWGWWGWGWGSSQNPGPVVTVKTATWVVNPVVQVSEMMSAYLFAFKSNITTQTTLEKANMNWDLLREHLAKMISNYAINVLGKKPNKLLSCSFIDIDNESTEMQWYIKTACQLWLMGKNTDEFLPRDTVTRAQFGTILSRLLYGSTNEGWSPYYSKHLSALQKNWIIKNTDPSLEEVRWYVMIMLMRSQTSK